jgi:hypothetical protein
MNLNVSKTDPENSLNLLLIDIGDISKMIGYTFKIINYLGNVVYESLISQQIFDLDLNTIGGRGTYFLQVTDDASQILEIKKIVLR